LCKAVGKEAKLSFTERALIDGGYGLINDVCFTQSEGQTEPESALSLLARQRRKHLSPIGIKEPWMICVSYY
jgi:hypothetical protein